MPWPTCWEPSESGTPQFERIHSLAFDMDNTDLDVYWRRKVAPVYVARALSACR